MRWFKDKIDDRIKALIADVVAAYVERSQLSFQLLSLEPNLTDIEMAVLWAAGVLVMEETHANAKAAGGQTEVMLHDITREFFDSCCQSYIDQVSKSSLKLDVDSEKIRQSIAPTLEAMSPQRLESSVNISAGLAANAAKLAGDTLLILSEGLAQKQGEAATKYAVSLVANRRDLNPFERAKATEWITCVSWARASR